ncbi:HTH domain-containing protein [Halonotius terrestris]|uniref:HTH domain-containing protein n=1 Tax=Halonotius terrestris TaxID=2487750 RepID=A0A8J8PD81_9EURY|nr:helix-turn-helix domain-containing protein [Halonotius terrestris]TQQ83067.1 HTH domain-containing protein [Halonotius terrestris]
MNPSLAEMLQTEMDCDGLLECFHGLKSLDRRCFRLLVEADSPLTVDDLAASVDRERSTVYRSVQRLLEAGVIKKEQINYEQGGYYHVYKPVAPEIIRDDMQRLLNDWYAEMGQLLQQFEDEFDEKAEPPVAPEP